MSEWISVSDRLPEFGVKVIVDGGIAYLSRQDNGTPSSPISSAKAQWYTITGFDYPGKPIQWEVTHWMPLPPPPEDK